LTVPYSRRVHRCCREWRGRNDGASSDRRMPGRALSFLPGSLRHIRMAPRVRRNQPMRIRTARRADLSAPVADFGNDHTRHRRNDVRCLPLHTQGARLVCIAVISPEPRGTMIIFTPATVRSRDNPSQRRRCRGQIVSARSGDTVDDRARLEKESPTCKNRMPQNRFSQSIARGWMK
jgi:hypothetical protein